MSLSRQYQQASAAGTQLLRGSRPGRASGLARLLEAEADERRARDVGAAQRPASVTHDAEVSRIISLIDNNDKDQQDKAAAKEAADAERARVE